MDKNAILLGSRALSWPRTERVYDRYGLVGLYDKNSKDEVISAAPVWHMETISANIEKPGAIVAKVIQTRKSSHVGDLFRNIHPTMPAIDEEILLGEGRLIQTVQDEVYLVGLFPDDERKTDWLNPNALYRAHEQTVELYFIPKS
jgi:hypothetical protein